MELCLTKFLAIVPPYTLGEQHEGIAPSKAMLPVGMMAVCTELRAIGAEVKFLDLVFERDWQAALSRVANTTIYDRILLSCHTARNIESCREVLNILDQADALRPVTVGGNSCLELDIEDFRELLGPSIENIVRGYAHGCPEQVLRGGQGMITLRTQRGYTIDQTILDQATHARYLEKSGGKYPLVGPGGFGCRWRCAYCAAHMNEKVTLRDDSIFTEIAAVRALGYSHIWCVDNLVLTNANRSQVIEFDQALAEAGLTWSGMTRPELIPEAEFLASLQALDEVAMGVETPSLDQLNRTLKRGARRDYFEKCREAFGRVNASGKRSNAFVMLDTPGATEEDFWCLARLLEQLEPSGISWSFYNPPAKELVRGTHSPRDFGFYHWPLGYSQVPTTRVVQQAMYLSGRWWSKWTPLHRPFYHDPDQFGVNFAEMQIFQPLGARAPTGDLWEAWMMERR